CREKQQPTSQTSSLMPTAAFNSRSSIVAGTRIPRDRNRRDRRQATHSAPPPPSSAKSGGIVSLPPLPRSTSAERFSSVISNTRVLQSQNRFQPLSSRPARKRSSEFRNLRRYLRATPHICNR